MHCESTQCHGIEEVIQAKEIWNLYLRDDMVAAVEEIMFVFLNHQLLKEHVDFSCNRI